MDAIELQNLLLNKTQELEELIRTNMHSKGNTESECQRLCLLNRLNEFEYAINGITDEDVII